MHASILHDRACAGDVDPTSSAMHRLVSQAGSMVRTAAVTDLGNQRCACIALGPNDADHHVAFSKDAHKILTVHHEYRP